MITRALEARQSPENPTTNLANPASWLYDALGGEKSWSGVRVNESTALRYATFYACVRLLSEDIGSLPFLLYRRSGRDRDRANEHPTYELLKSRPNPEIPGPMPFYETLQGHLGTWGNAYAEIEFLEGRPVALWPLPPHRTTAVRKDGRKWIITRLPNGTDVKLPAERVLHVPGFGYDGVIGYSIVKLLKQGIGRALAAEQHGARFFDNAARPSGVLQHPGLLSAEAAKHLREAFDASARGLENAWRTILLEEGLKWERVGVDPADSQLIEQETFSAKEMARAFRIPLVMLGLEENPQVGNSVEQFNINYVVHTLRPWLSRWEGAIEHALLLPSERRGGMYVEALTDALLRGDVKSRYEAYALGRQWGFFSANDVREKENMKTIGPQGDTYLVPLNMVPADVVGQLFGGGGSDGGAAASAALDSAATRALLTAGGAVRRELRNVAARVRIVDAHKRVMLSAAERIVRREIRAVRNAVERTLGERGARDLADWLDEFYDKEPEVLRDAFRSHLAALYQMVRGAVADEIGADAPDGDFTIDEGRFLRDYVEAMANRLSAASHAQLRALMRRALDETEMREMLLAYLDEWEEKKPEKIARREVARANNAFALATYGALAVVTVRWVTIDPSCPFCEQLSGRVVTTGAAFLADGATLEADGQSPLRVTLTRHPPIHDGCDCLVMADTTPHGAPALVPPSEDGEG